MERVLITNPMNGIIAMNVCAEKDATDEEILTKCNKDNPAGTTNGWRIVIRELSQGNDREDSLPVTCGDDDNRVHYIVTC